MDVSHLSIREINSLFTKKELKPSELYSKVFGCEPVYESNELTFLAFDEEHHRVAIANTYPVFKSLSFIHLLII